VTGYSADLAYVHDVGFSGFAVNAGPGLLQILRSKGVRDGLVVDLGCGSGIWAARLVAEGFGVLGIDISPPMIKIARRNAPGARFRVGSLFTSDLPSCDAVTSLGECINYTFDPDAKSKAIKSFFGRVFEALRPGGVFIFDFAEPGQTAPGAIRNGQLVKDDWAILFAVEESRVRRSLTRKMTIFRKKGANRWFRTDESHVQCLYRAAGVVRQLRRTGFHVRLVRSFGGMPLPPAHAGIIAVKPTK
jgi:SAM-dependent methyltransferase